MVLLALTLPGCTEATRERIRDWTYPPDFNYISSQELRSTMGRIATEVTALNELLRDGAQPDRQAVLGRLRALDEAARALGSDAWPSNHPRISENAQRFQRDVVEALLAVQHEPPKYFLAGSIAGSCSICHAN